MAVSAAERPVRDLRRAIPAPRLAPAGGDTSLVAALKEELAAPPAARATARRVMQVIESETSSATDIAKAAKADASLTGRILRAANSAYYGLSGRVATPAFAVTVVGFATVRSLSAIAASGLSGDDVAPDFWERAAAVATGAALLAGRVGADAPAAFGAGLLHDLGTALLRQRAGQEHADLVARAADEASLLELEQAVLGGTHASLAADVLLAWHFPANLCDAVGMHHAPAHVTSPPVRRALQGSLALAAGLTPEDDDGAALLAANVHEEDLEPLRAQMADGAEQLAIALSA